jgi:hypothetical protein
MRTAIVDLMLAHFSPCDNLPSSIHNASCLAISSANVFLTSAKYSSSMSTLTPVRASALLISRQALCASMVAADCSKPIVWLPPSGTVGIATGIFLQCQSKYSECEAQVRTESRMERGHCYKRDVRSMRVFQRAVFLPYVTLPCPTTFSNLSQWIKVLGKTHKVGRSA